MLLKSIFLRNFRNFSEKNCELSENLTLVIGNNAQGKTNILEGIHVLLTGKGFKDDRQEELIKKGEHEMNVEGYLESDNDTTELKVHLSLSEKSRIKAFFVDKSRKQLNTYLSATPAVVVFAPSLISIIDGQPSLRRKLFDSILSKIDIEYRKRLNNYENALRKRNRILEKTPDKVKLQAELNFWDVYLIEQANYIVSKRKWLTDQLNADVTLDTHEFACHYEPNILSIETLEASFDRQYYQKRTLVGPQRDDISIMHKKDGESSSVSTYGSRGEQRLALLWLILHQTRIFSDELQYKPILLLDDIFSELDETNRHIIHDLIQDYQTVITSTENEYAGNKSDKMVIIKIQA